MAGVLTITIAAAAACKPHDPHGPPRSTGTTATSGTVPGTIDCGTVDYADTSGAPTTRPVTITAEATCLLDALPAGRPARLVTLNTIDELGRPVGTVTWQVLGPDRLRVTTGDLVQECVGASIKGNLLVQNNCSPQPPAAPPLVGTDCGLIAYASGWPTTLLQNLESGPGKCFLDAWEAGTPARLVTRDQTDGQGGHIRIVTYDVLGLGQLRVITDDRQARDGGGITTQQCASLAHTRTHLQPGACTPA